MRTEVHAESIREKAAPPLADAAFDYRTASVDVLADQHRRYGDVFSVFDRGSTEVYLRHPEDVHTALLHATPQSFAEIDVLGDPPHTEFDKREVAPAHRAAIAALRAEAITNELDAIDRALRGQLRALVGTEFDAVTVLPKVCARAALPLCLQGSAPGLVSAAVMAARTRLRQIEAHQVHFRWLPNRRRRQAEIAQQRLLAEVRRVTAQQHSRDPAQCPRTVLDHIRDDATLARSPLSTHLLATVATATTVVPAMALAWLIYELSQRWDDVRRIRAEAFNRPTRLDGHDLAVRLPYTTAFVREVLRLHPPAWLVSREIAAELQLGSYQLSPKQKALFSPYLIHRDPRWWDEPEVFAPERWLAPRAPHAQHAYLPFGPSRFTTLFSTTVLTLAAAQLSAEYTIAPRQSTPARIHFGAVLRPAKLRVRLNRPQGLIQKHSRPIA